MNGNQPLILTGVGTTTVIAALITYLARRGSKSECEGLDDVCEWKEDQLRETVHRDQHLRGILNIFSTSVFT